MFGLLWHYGLIICPLLATHQPTQSFSWCVMLQCNTKPHWTPWLNIWPQSILCVCVFVQERKGTLFPYKGKWLMALYLCLWPCVLYDQTIDPVTHTHQHKCLCLQMCIHILLLLLDTEWIKNRGKKERILDLDTNQTQTQCWTAGYENKLWALLKAFGNHQKRTEE